MVLTFYAKKYGAEVPFLRPRNLSKDNTTTEKTLQHALLTYEKIKGIKYTILGSRRTSLNPVIKKTDQKTMAEIGPVGRPYNSTRSTDFNAIKSGFISITPLTIDMSDTTKIINRIFKPN